MIALLANMRAHNVFYVSLLKKYVHDPNHIIDWNVIQVELEGEFQVEPMCILDFAPESSHRTCKGVMEKHWSQ